MRRVAWSPRALRELRDQRRYIARTQPDAAARIVMRILATTDRLEAYPRYGRVASWDETRQLRELPIAGTPFVVLYTVDDATETVRILRVLHGAQQRET